MLYKHALLFEKTRMVVDFINTQRSTPLDSLVEHPVIGFAINAFCLQTAQRKRFSMSTRQLQGKVCYSSYISSFMAITYAFYKNNASRCRFVFGLSTRRQNLHQSLASPPRAQPAQNKSTTRKSSLHCVVSANCLSVKRRQPK